MPLYEYQCAACGKQFERIRKFSDPPLKKCDICGKGPITKLLSAPGIAFKGSGFYITDYAKGSSSASATGQKSETKSESKTESKTESTADSKSESKPAAKPETK
ncbi:MAG: zinc ribbon domain-containing protein [Acidobacteria bacterium]|nr:MAG: zinc ribbon domain-containing protein [Acidobacteriota bacterium]